jgi:CRISPR-associated protein Csx3
MLKQILKSLLLDNKGGKKMITFNVIETENYSLIQFNIEGVLSPSILKEVVPPKINNKKGVIISGRGPIWLYAWMVHQYHPSSWIAVYDPRIGAVVTPTHSPAHQVGDIIEINLE